MELLQKLKHYRISKDEHERIKNLLGRDLKPIEWPLFSALWSEHCSYKSSKVHLRKFSYRNLMTRDDSDENAGVVDLGYGEKIIFKMESHNHPSFIEPFQGAATGVGGILRDIFTMGARPIALADFLCFGELAAERMPYLQKEVVHGISSYGNCVGVPTVTGFTEYDSSYNKNILVNAMAVGMITQDMSIASSKAQGVGNYVVYVGAKTGKDGVHGAAMASESFGSDNQAKKPNIQMGDPFYEKLLIESCLEVLNENLVVAIQDMGAAGLTSSSFEMAAKGKVGFDLHLDLVPSRDASLTPEDILLSESQERMLLVCEPKNYARIVEIFQKWDLDAVKVGEINALKKMQIYWKQELLTSMDPGLIVDSAPRYERSFEKPLRPHQLKSIHDFQKKIQDALSTGTLSMGTLSLPATSQNSVQNSVQNSLRNSVDVFLKNLSLDESFKSKEWIYRQYDQRVGLRTQLDASRTIAVLRLPSQRQLAMSVGCRPSLMKMDTVIGAKDALLYPALQMAIKGFKPLAITDCLNFGNPEKIPVMSDFVTTVDLFAEISEKLDAPVISGNVSFYNETEGKDITPTPAVGMVGIRESSELLSECQFKEADLEVYWARSTSGCKTLNKVSKYLKIDSQFTGDIDVNYWVKLIADMVSFVGANKPNVARVVGYGGVLMSLKKMSTTYSLKGHSRFFQRPNVMVELVEENLYDFIFAVEKNKRDEFSKNLTLWAQKWELEVINLGFTHLGAMEL